MAEQKGPAAVSADAQFWEVLKARREALGLSLRTLAARAGFSASFLSQVETGQASPSIGSLERIASELGLTLAGLFSASRQAGTVVRADARDGFTSNWSRARLESLIPPATDIRALEALSVTVQPGGLSGKHLAARSTDQFVYVVTGSITLFFGDEELRLKRGDSAFVPRGAPHRWENGSNVTAEILLVSATNQPS